MDYGFKLSKTWLKSDLKYILYSVVWIVLKFSDSYFHLRFLIKQPSMPDYFCDTKYLNIKYISLLLFYLGLFPAMQQVSNRFL